MRDCILFLCCTLALIIKAEDAVSIREGSIDEEIAKAKQDYDKAYSKVSNLYALKDDKNSALMEIEKIEKELEGLRNKKEKRIGTLSMVQVEYGYEMERYDTYVKRSKIGQFFLGDKRVERERRKEYRDRQSY